MWNAISVIYCMIYCNLWSNSCSKSWIMEHCNGKMRECPKIVRDQAYHEYSNCWKALCLSVVVVASGNALPVSLEWCVCLIRNFWFGLIIGVVTTRRLSKVTKLPIIVSNCSSTTVLNRNIFLNQISSCWPSLRHNTANKAAHLSWMKAVIDKCKPFFLCYNEDLLKALIVESLYRSGLILRNSWTRIFHVDDLLL